MMQQMPFHRGVCRVERGAATVRARVTRGSGFPAVKDRDDVHRKGARVCLHAFWVGSNRGHHVIIVDARTRRTRAGRIRRPAVALHTLNVGTRLVLGPARGRGSAAAAGTGEAEQRGGTRGHNARTPALVPAGGGNAPEPRCTAA